MRFCSSEKEKWNNPLSSFLTGELMYKATAKGSLQPLLHYVSVCLFFPFSRLLLTNQVPLTEQWIRRRLAEDEQSEHLPAVTRLFIDSIEMPSVTSSPEVQWLSECHCQCLSDDPACFHPSQPAVVQRWKPSRGRYFKSSIIAASLEASWGGSIGGGACLVCFSAEGKKTGRGEGRVGTASPGHTSSYLLLCLMALHQNVQAAVDGANGNVSQRCGPRGHGEPWRRQGDATGPACIVL